MGKLDAKLAKAGKFFKTAAKKVKENPDQGFAEWEDGRYAVQLNSCKVNESKSSGRLQVSFQLVGLDGEYKGQSVFHHQGIENEQGLEFLFRDFSRLGFQAPENPDELEALCAKIEKKKPKVRILLKTKGEYQNVRFLGGLTAEEAEEASEEREDVAGEEEETGEGEAELKEGSKVEVTLKSGKTVQGTVIEILEDDNKVRVECEDDKTYKVDPDQVTLLESEEVPEEPSEEEESEEEESEEEESEEEEVTPSKKPKGKVTKPAGKLRKK